MSDSEPIDSSVYDLISRRLAAHNDPSQPRVPAGSSRGGEFTSKGGAKARSKAAKSTKSSGKSGGESGAKGARTVADIDKELSKLIDTPGWFMNPELLEKHKGLNAEKATLKATSGGGSSSFGGEGATKPTAKQVQALKDAIGGGAKFTGGQLEHDPGASLIAERGKHISGEGKSNVSKADGHCHWNVAEAYERGEVDAVVIGYAQHPDNNGAWHQHTWGMKGGKVVETTPSNFAVKSYFGVPLSGSEAKDFVAHSKSARPGQGRMRFTNSDPVSNVDADTGVTEADREEQPWLSFNVQVGEESYVADDPNDTTAVALENTRAVADALAAHDWEDWYIALLHAAVDETGDVGRAIEVANAAYEEVNADPNNPPNDDDVWKALGISKVDALRALGMPAPVENAAAWAEGEDVDNGGEEEGGNGDDPFDYLVHELCLTEEQAEAVIANFNPHHDAMGRFASKGASGRGAGARSARRQAEKRHGKETITGEGRTPPPPGKNMYKPDVERDHNGDGVTDFARIGVAAMAVPPPPPVGKLPNLNAHERLHEKTFIDAYHADPDGMARKFRRIIDEGTKPGEPPTFGTDDAKQLADVWNHPDQATRAQNRATLNNPLHQTANAIAKRAFVQELDRLKEGDELMVTVGGCGAGKGYALKNVPEALAMKNRAKAIWDSAGDQNATENPWIQREAEARGLKVNYVFVHAEPYKQWADPDRGVVKRAGDPADGRMVDAKVFADSYALGAKNHQAFYDKHKDNPDAAFVFLSNIGKPSLIPGVPKEALGIDRKHLAAYAEQAVLDSPAPKHVKRGGTIGRRIWSDE